MTSSRAPSARMTLRSTPSPVRCLLLCVFVNQAGAFVQAFLILFLIGNGIDEGRAGFALGAYGLGAVLGSFVGGDLADRLGRRPTIVLSLASSALLTIAIGFLGTAHDYVPLLVVVFADGMMTQTYRPAAMAMLADLVPGDGLVMAFAIYRMVLNVGAVVGPLAAAGLVRLSWDLLFWADGLTALACAAIAWRNLPAPARRCRSANGRETGPSSASAYLGLLRDGRFGLYLLAMFASALIYMQYYSVLPLKIRAESYSSVVYSAVLAVSGVLVVTCELLVTRRVQTWPPAYAGVGGILLLALGLTAYGPRGGLALLFGATVVGVLGQIVAGPTMFAHPSRVAPGAARGRYTGASHAAFGLGSAAGPFFGVLLWNGIGAGVWALCGLVGVLAAVAASFAMRERPSMYQPRPAPLSTAQSPTPKGIR